MPLPTIACCYKSCGTKVWAPSNGELTVHCSSATCMTCRRVALCLEHFEAIREQQGDLRCPNCGGTRWHVVLFEPRTLPPAMTTEVNEHNGHIEVRFVSTGTTADLVDSLPPRGGSMDGEDEGWVLARASSMAAGARPIAEGVHLTVRGDGAHLVLDEGLQRIHVPGIVRSAARGGGTLLVEGARTPQAPSTLLCYAGASPRGRLSSPYQLGLRAPTAIGDGRYLYLQELPDGRVELRALQFGDAPRATSRRVGRAWTAPREAPLTAMGDGACLVFSREGDGFQAAALEVASGASRPLGEPAAAPRVAAGATQAAVAAWIDDDGAVHVAADGTARTLGTAGPGALLAVSRDGAEVAWIDGALHVARVDTGEVDRRRVPDDVVRLDPA